MDDTNVIMAVIIASACLGALVGVACTIMYFANKVEDRAIELFNDFVEWDRKQFRSGRQG